MAGNWFKKLFGNKGGRLETPVSGRNRPKKSHPSNGQHPNEKRKSKSEVKPDLTIWGRVKTSVGCLFGQPPYLKGSNSIHTLIEVDSEYVAHKSNFSACLPCLMVVGLCLLLERPYPFTIHLERFDHCNKDISSLLTPMLTLPAVVMLTHFLGRLWSMVALKLGQDRVHFTHTFGRLLDVGLATFVYRGLLNLLKLWEAVDRKLPVGCILSDQCAISGSICHAITKFMSYPHILMGHTTDLCDDGESKKLGQLLLNFVVLLIILSGLFTLRIHVELTTLEVKTAPIRVTLTKGKSKKVREVFPDEEAVPGFKLGSDDFEKPMETDDHDANSLMPINMPGSTIENSNTNGLASSPIRQKDQNRSGSKSKAKTRKRRSRLDN